MALSFRAKLVLSTILALVISTGAALAVGAHLHAKIAKEQAALVAKSQLTGIAETVQGDLDAAFILTSTLADTVGGYLKTVPPAQRDRALIINQLTMLLASHPEYVGIYAAFEPDAFDGADKAHIGKPGSTGNGRFSPYVNRDGDRIAIEASEDSDSTEVDPASGVAKGAWYLEPKRTGKPCIIDPYRYTVQNRTVWMTSATVPIMVDGRFIGMVGTDISLAHLEDLLATYRKGHPGTNAFVCSPSGRLAGVSGFSGVSTGGHIKEIHGADFKEDLAQVAAERLFTDEDVTNPGMFEGFAAFPVRGTGIDWIVGTLTSTSEVYAAGREALRDQLLVAAVAGLLATILAWLLAGRVVRLVTSMTASLDAVVAGDYSRRVQTGGDEMGRLAGALNRTVETLGRLDERISTGIAGGARSVGGAARTLGTTSNSLHHDAEATSRQAATASSAAEQVAANINTVTAAVEELNASAQEISRNAIEAAGIARDAVQVSGQVGGRMQDLAKAAEAIGGIVRTISAIAEQTNLLALNATIEAARAGEAGRGFAVVASEVKNLARQAGTASADIAQRITAMQQATASAVEGLGQVDGIVKRIDGTQQTIAAATEEQTATVSEISRNVSEAAKGGSEIAGAVTAVAEAAKRTEGGAAEARRLSSELERLAADLEALTRR
jgi:methyl-accepting chemotaxis protein